MYLEQCSKSFNANIEVEDITIKSFNLTLFKPLIEIFLDKSAEDFDIMEDKEIELRQMKDVAFCYNKKDIVTSIDKLNIVSKTPTPENNDACGSMSEEKNEF